MCLISLSALFLLMFTASPQVIRAEEIDDLLEENKMTEKEFHNKYAVGLNNLVWHLMDKPDRTIQENDQMIHAAHTSYYHWSRIGSELNLQRGEWLISRVYAVLNRPEGALFHAQRCLELTEEHNFTDFDLAYAYEAMARAHAAAGNKSETEKYLQLAAEAGEKIEAEENRTLFFEDLDSEPW
jgi:hypothetical protein